MRRATSISISDTLTQRPFGMLMVGRNQELGSGYKYGFNGKENEDEIAGNNNYLDFGARVYDARLGKWLSLDPLQKKMSDISPFVFALNTPIIAIDLDGRITFFVAGAAINDPGKDPKIETFSSDLIKTFRNILGEDHFKTLESSTQHTLGEKAAWTVSNGFAPLLDNANDDILENAFNEVVDGFNNAQAANPNKDETINLIGSSYGSVLVAQLAIKLAKEGLPIKSVVITASPLDPDSDLGKAMAELKAQGIKIIYQPNKGDASAGIFGANKKEFILNSLDRLLTQPYKFFGHLTNMYNTKRVDRILEKTLAEGTEGSKAQENAQIELLKRKDK